MSRKHRKPLPPLLPAQPYPAHHVQHDDTKFSTVKPPNPATNPFHYLDSQVLPSWSYLDDSIWKADRTDAASLQRGNRAEHGVIHVYYCSPVSHHHTPIPLKDHGIPNFYLSQEADHSLESTSILYLPPLNLYQLRRIDSTPMSNVAERLPGADFSTMQTIDPALVFPDTFTTTPEPLSFTANLGAAAEVCPILADTGISPWFLDQPPGHSQIDKSACLNDLSLPDCHVYDKKPDHKPEVKDQEFDMHKRKFKCSIIGCRMGFKRRDHLERHTRSHSKEKPYVCWVPGCHRAFSRRDNLKVHCTKTHARSGGRNRYVATLDETSPDYDPDFRGQLSFDGRPLRFSAPTSPLSEAKPQQP